MKSVVILTGSELRHTFFRKFLGLAEDIHVKHSYCEKPEKATHSISHEDRDNSLRTRHFLNREQSEKDFFELFVNSTPDNSNPVFLTKGEVNSQSCTNTVIESKPDLLIAYGCSIIKEPLLSAFSGRFINVHLGLSPYYRGSGTNYWPLVNNEPEYVGATYMYIDEGIDTGEIIHQIRARVVWGDTPSTIGNRLIQDMASVCCEVVRQFENLKKMKQPDNSIEQKVYRQRDFSEESVKQLYDDLSDGLVQKYLSEYVQRCERVSIVQNPAIRKLK